VCVIPAPALLGWTTAFYQRLPCLDVSPPRTHLPPLPPCRPVVLWQLRNPHGSIVTDYPDNNIYEWSPSHPSWCVPDAPRLGCRAPVLCRPQGACARELSLVRAGIFSKSGGSHPASPPSPMNPQLWTQALDGGRAASARASFQGSHGRAPEGRRDVDHLGGIPEVCRCIAGVTRAHMPTRGIMHSTGATAARVSPIASHLLGDGDEMDNVWGERNRRVCELVNS
jgi:hypothetical protein